MVEGLVGMRSSVGTNDYATTEDKVPTREYVLRKAIEIGKDRGSTHGDAVDNMNHTATLWSAYLRVSISAADVALMMNLLKVSRIKCGTPQNDHFIDAAGYIAIAAQCS